MSDPLYILGINCYSHEASCSLVKDGEICSLIEEERLNREKHTWKFPKQAIEQCLAMEKIRLEDVDRITFFLDPVKEIRDNIFFIPRYFPQSLNLFISKSGGTSLSILRRIFAMMAIGQKIKEEFSLKRAPKVSFIEHHLGHAASAFFVSGFEESAILTLDGRGESTTTLMSVGRGNKIEKILEIKVPHSLGHFYSAVTDYLGFKPFLDEYKVMGMSAYGKDTYLKDFADVIHLLDDGTFRLNLKYFRFHTHGQRQWVSPDFIKKFGPKRLGPDDYDQRHFDIAYALQKTVEKAGVHIANRLYKLTGISNLCMAGGVVLNVLMNQQIIHQTPFKNIFLQPIANDTGTSFGSALYYYHQKLGMPRKFKFSNIYLGPAYSDDVIRQALAKYNLDFRKCQNIAAETASYIAQGKIVGWFQERMEAGPRALGNRSITVNPMDPNMKDRLNLRVKKREFFRPFAPSILEEKVSEYFEMPKNYKSPHMIMVGHVKPEKRRVIPSVTHVDHTARVHTVSQSDNPRYWQLIHEFEKITGVPVLLNTSFNENEPIVCTPDHAIECFLRTELDVLAIGDYLVLRPSPAS